MPARPERPAASAAGQLEPARPIGPGRLLALVYGFFTLAAGARSAVQLSTRFGQAPLAYLLSGLAAVIYLLGMVLILRADRQPRSASRARTARGLCFVELAGVVLVGSASLLLPDAFPDATVWSGFGSGYGYVPAILPILALYWLHRHPGRPAASPGPVFIETDGVTARSAPRSVVARWRRPASQTRAGRTDR